MRLLFTKTLQVFDGIKEWLFERMKVYSIPQPYANEIKVEGYAVELGFTHELPIDGYTTEIENKAVIPK